MTEVVTSTAAYVQPLLLAPKGQQAFGAPAPDSPQTESAIALAASQQQHALEATQVAASPDQPSLKNDSEGSSSNRSFLQQLPTPQPTKAPDLAVPTTGPAKARVDVSVLDITAALNAASQTVHPTPAAAAQQTPVAPSAPAPQPAPNPVTLSSLGGGPAGPASQAEDDTPDTPISTGVLGPAAVVKDADLANLSQSIFGAAFAPTQVAQTNPDATQTQTQKNFIFAHRKLYAEQAAQVQITTGKFAAEEAKTNGTEGAGKFAAQPAAVAAATAGSQFAASAEAAQKLADKVQFTSTSSTEGTTGEARLYDKVGQADTQNQRQHGDNNNPSDSSLDSRQSLYQRAQAVAAALGEKSGNPAVKKLVATLESYALIAGVDSSGARKPVRVTA
jgi:hypothetical protein